MPVRVIECEYCGYDFEADTYMRKICDSCLKELYRSSKKNEKKENSNAKIIELVREASKLGLSYGEYQRRMK